MSNDNKNSHEKHDNDKIVSKNTKKPLEKEALEKAGGESSNPEVGDKIKQDLPKQRRIGSHFGSRI